MKKLLPIALLLLLGACINPDTRYKDQQAAWEASLPDSVDALRREMQLTQDSITYTGAELDSLLLKFEHVSDPRLVEGYSIFKGARAGYPLTATGLTARITESGQLELIAALSGGTFDRIKVEAGGESAETETVPFDQGLNYRTGGLNTVAFTGGKADTVAGVIASAAGAVKVIYLNGRQSGSLTLSAPAKEAISTTYRYTETSRRLALLERRLPMLQQKIKILEARISKSDKDKKNNK